MWSSPGQSLIVFVASLVTVGCYDSPQLDEHSASGESQQLSLTDANPENHLESDIEPSTNQPTEHSQMSRQTITLGAGCFWCIEAVLERVKGVASVESGYMGGTVDNPTYELVCEGKTNHAEVVQVTFNTDELPLDRLLDVFWKLHDPTTLNRQGFDVGTQYRSAIFYHTEEQREAAEASKKKWDASGEFTDPIVTEITSATKFYPAEHYHQDFFARNPTHPYCRANILPKFQKLGLLKESDL